MSPRPVPREVVEARIAAAVDDRPFLLLVVGHPAEGARVPAIERKPLAAIASWV